MNIKKLTAGIVQELQYSRGPNVLFHGNFSQETVGIIRCSAMIYGLMYSHVHCGSKNQTPAIFSNNFNKYWPTSIFLVHEIYKGSSVFW